MKVIPQRLRCLIGLHDRFKHSHVSYLRADIYVCLNCGKPKFKNYVAWDKALEGEE